LDSEAEKQNILIVHIRHCVDYKKCSTYSPNTPMRVSWLVHSKNCWVVSIASK